MEGESPQMCMWSYAASAMPVAGIFGRILGRYIARGQVHRYLVGRRCLRGQQLAGSEVRHPGPHSLGGDLAVCRA
jgi:hypothetical protein